MGGSVSISARKVGVRATEDTVCVRVLVVKGTARAARTSRSPAIRNDGRWSAAQNNGITHGRLGIEALTPRV